MTAAAARRQWGWPPGDAAAPSPDGTPAYQPAADLAPAEFRDAVRVIFAGLAGTLDKAGSRAEAQPAAEDAARRWATDFLRRGGMMVAPGTQAQLAQAVLDERFGLGPLQPWIDNGDVENIDINGPHQVWLQMRDGTKVPAPAVAGDDAELIEMVRRWGLHGGQTPREFSEYRPVMNAALGADVRLSAVMAVTRRVHVSIRVHRLVDIALWDLVGSPYQTLTPGLAEFLAAAVAAHKNILVTGGVGAGKTTLLRALAAAIHPDERIATLESDLELHLDRLPDRHHDVVAMEARQANSEGAGEITLHDLIPAALRLNPRRIIVGEVRDTEIRPMLEAMNSGHEGSMATLHANSAEEVFSRILMLALRGHMALAAEEIHLSVGMSRPFVVHLRTGGAGGHERYVSEVLEVMPPGDGIQPSYNRVFTPGADGRAQFTHALSDEAALELEQAGFNFGVTAGARR
jgi:Flp pilus assembly CpaF family ATPase